MNHLILGKGNLGIDLMLEINKLGGHKVQLASRSTGLVVETGKVGRKQVSTQMILDYDADVVWYCVGGGSVNETKKDRDTARFLNCEFPTLLQVSLPKGVKFVAFSTDYVANEQKPNDPQQQVKTIVSDYARDKLDLENNIDYIGRPHTAVVRVGSLYGVHRTEKTFPGKILKNFGSGELLGPIRLPQNLVTPTPTRWAAGMLMRAFDQLFSKNAPTRHHLAPKGNVSVEDWGKMILKHRSYKDFFRGEGTFLDLERPAFSNLDCSFNELYVPHWNELWKLYYWPDWFRPR